MFDKVPEFKQRLWNRMEMFQIIGDLEELIRLEDPFLDFGQRLWQQIEVFQTCWQLKGFEMYDEVQKWRLVGVGSCHFWNEVLKSNHL